MLEPSSWKEKNPYLTGQKKYSKTDMTGEEDLCLLIDFIKLKYSCEAFGWKDNIILKSISFLPFPYCCKYDPSSLFGPHNSPFFLLPLSRWNLNTMSVRVAEVAREHGWHLLKSLDSDENFKPEHTLFYRELRFVAIYPLFGDLWAKKVPVWVKNSIFHGIYH